LIERRELGPSTGPLVAVGIFIALIHGAWWLMGDAVTVADNLADGDGYARLLRVTRLLETGAWFDSSLPRANAPYGGSLHWTRPFDVLLLALALPLMPVVGFSKALFWSGVIVSPLLHVVSAFTLVWAVTPMVGRAAAAFAGVLTVTQMGIMGYATVGHADHHMAFALIAIVALGFAIRLLIMPDVRRGGALAVGLTLAVGIWVGPEFLGVLALTLLAVGLVWLAGEPGAVTKNMGVAQGLALGLGLAVLIEHGPQAFFAIEYDRVSIVALTGSLLVLAFWGGVVVTTRLKKREWGLAGRLAIALVGMGAISTAMWLLFPNILVGPLGDMDPAFLYLFDDIAEFESVGGLSRFLIYLGGAVFALPWVVWRARRQWQEPNRWVWVGIAGGLLVSVVLASLWLRASLYAGIFLAVVLADLIDHVVGAIAKRFSGPVRSFCVVSAVLFLAVGPLTVGAGTLNAGSGGVGKTCPVQALTRNLNRPPWAARSLTILGSANFGPEILYRTNHKVLGTLHHRNSAGILDSVKILGGADEALVRRLIRERRVDLIVLCPGSGSDGYLLGRDGGPIFYRRLENGEIPDWLREVKLPEKLGLSFRLFEVVALP
jgi:hypothetical protein